MPTRRSNPLHKAIKAASKKKGGGTAKNIEAVLRASMLGHIDFNEIDEGTGFTALHLLCVLNLYPSLSRDDMEVYVKFLLRRKGIRVDELDAHSGSQFGLTPLHCATRSCLPGIVQILLESGANPKARTKSHGYTPLHFACGTYRARKEIVRLLLKAGADPNIADNTGSLPLHFLNPSDIDIVHLLLEGSHSEEEKLKALRMQNTLGDTALHLSLYQYKEVYTKGSMIVHKIDPHDDMDDIYWLGELEGAEMAKFLIESGADVLTPNNKGMKPIDIIGKVLAKRIWQDPDWYSVSDDLDLVIGFLATTAPAMLQQLEANRHETVDTLPLNTIASIAGKMLLRVMAEFVGDGGPGLDIFQHVDPLIDMGADPNYTDPDTGYNALHTLLDNSDLRKDLIAIEWSGIVDDDYDESMQGDYVHNLDGLVSRLGSFILWDKTKDGRNAVHFASANGDAKVVKRMLELANQQEQDGLQHPLLNVNEPDVNGWTPLHFACDCSHGLSDDDRGTVEVLIRNGSLVTNLTKQDGAGKTWTPWEVAAKQGNSDVMEFLKTSPLVRNQLHEWCKRACTSEGGWPPGLTGMLLERLLRSSPAGVNVVYKFLPPLLLPKQHQ